MFGWIRRMYDAVSGDIDETVRGWVHDLVNGLYGFLHLIFGDIGAAWDKLVHAIWLAWHAVAIFTEAVWYKFYQIVRQIIPAIIREYRALYHDAVNLANKVLAWAQHAISVVTHALETAIRDLTNWVVQHVYDPLKKAFDAAWQWITHEGATIWHYISNPPLLAALIFDDLIALLERNAWAVAGKLGKFGLSLITHNLRQFATLIEDILDAIL